MKNKVDSTLVHAYDYFLSPARANGINSVLSECIEFVHVALNAISCGSSASQDGVFNVFLQDNTGRLFHLWPSESKITLTIPTNLLDMHVFEAFLFGKVSIHKVINCAILAYLGEDACDLDSDFRYEKHAWNGYEAVNSFTNDIIIPPEVERITDELKLSGVCWCYNKSCTGKTFIGIYCLRQAGVKFIYNRNYSKSLSIGEAIALICFGENISLLIDDLQCNWHEARIIIKCINEHSSSVKNRKCKIIILSWVDIYRSLKNISNNIQAIRLDEKNIIPIMLGNKINKHIMSIIRPLVGENIALIDAARHSNLTDSCTISNARHQIFSYLVSIENKFDILPLYVGCVLGAYEFEAPKEFLKIFAESMSFPEFSIRGLKILDDNIYFGHRSVCEFILSFIEGNKLVSNTRRDIIIEYLQYIGPTKMWSALSQILSGDTSTDAGKLLIVWRLVAGFEKEINLMSEGDPSWMDTPSSMYFVIRSFSVLGVLDKHVSVVKSFVSIFQKKNGVLLIDTERLKTRNDFIKIKDYMIKEDISSPVDWWEKGDSINDTFMHENWILGLGAGLRDEMYACGFTDIHREIIDEIFRRQLETGGWYPRRVPWVTSRVLIGLGRSGFNMVNSTNINRAVNELVSRMEYDGSWNARTGGWNNPYETTAMALDAINACDATLSISQNVYQALKFLRESKKTWMADRNEIDGSYAAAVLVKYGMLDDDIINYVNDMSIREIYRIVQTTKVLNYDSYQSCTTAQIAFSLIDLGWYLVKRDVAGLLNNFLEKAKGINNMKIFISYSHDSDNHKRRVRKIADHLRSNGHEVIFDQYLPYGSDLYKFMEEIDDSDIILIIGTKMYLEKAKASKGGVSYEGAILSWQKIMGRSDKIIPISLDKEFGDAIPLVFRGNKGVVRSRIDATCLKEIEMAVTSKT